MARYGGDDVESYDPETDPYPNVGADPKSGGDHQALEISLTGEELEEYCNKHGLCPLCAVTQTHKRVFRLTKKNPWLPITSTNKDDGRYVVYKGYCVQPCCFTLEQAKRLLGEIGPSVPAPLDAYYQSDSSNKSNKNNAGREGSSATNETRQEQRGHHQQSMDPDEIPMTGSNSKKKKNGISRLLRGRGSRSSGNSSSNRSKSGDSVSNGSRPSQKNEPTLYLDFGLAGFTVGPASSGMSSTKSRSSKNRNRSSSGSGRSVRSSSGRSVTSEIRRDNDDMSVGSAMTSESKVRSSLRQLLQDNMGTMLDLSSTKLHHVHVTELVHSLNVATSLQTLILENCILNDNEIEIIGNGLASDDMAAPLLRLSFRSNRIGNRGAVSLKAYFTKSTTLQELDLSKNQIGSRGATATLHAFRDNPNTRIKMINFAHNEIWDPDDGSFFVQNDTLQLLNLEGNFVHDEGIESIAKGIRANPARTKLSELYLGWNGIGDEGCIQLARMLESNSSLLKLGLGENDITSVGARAILSSLASNQTLRDITGLYHNQIDRKFIIASIKRLLHSHVEAITSEYEAQQRVRVMMEESLHAMDTLAEPLGSQLPPPDEVSESSLDWADKLYHGGSNGQPPPLTEINTPGVPLGNLDTSVEHGDDSVGETSINQHRANKAVEEQAFKDDDAATASPSMPSPNSSMTRRYRFMEMPPPRVTSDRLMMLQSAPLSFVDKTSGLHHAFPLHDFDHERAIVQYSLEASAKLDATIELDVEPATVDTLKAFFDSATSRVLHFSSFGHPRHVLAFENGEGYLDSSMTIENLHSLVSSANPPLQLVVVNSFHSGRIGKAFLDAGVPHVICCHHTEIFRDKASYSFIKNLYRGLALNKSLKQAFQQAQEAVRVEEISKHVERYVLLPQKAEDDTYHDVPIFYTRAVPVSGLSPEADIQALDEARARLPPIPKHFIGREVDMCQILEALRVDDVVRVGGVKGSGKTSLVAATCRYIQQRSSTFKFDEVFWLPPSAGVVPEQDTLFGDLAEYTDRMIKADHDISEDGDAVECRVRIELELEGKKTLIAIDSRKFDTETAAESLEKFLGQLLNSNLDIKIILISPGSSLDEEEEEDDTIRLGPVDFKSTALLFGEISRFITANGCPAAQSPDEFAALMVPPSVANLQDHSKVSSMRRANLMSHLGNGIPASVIKAGKTMPASTFIHLIGMANTPEVRVDSCSSLDAAVSKWTTQKEWAVAKRNYLRALDLEHVLKEIQSQRSLFPSLDDLIAKEQELHRRHTQCFKSRKYEEGNRLKREILTLKKRIMQERRYASSQQNTTMANPDRITDIQAQVDDIMRRANSSFTSLNELVTPDKVDAVFSLGSAYHHCEVRIHPGNFCEFDPGRDLGAAVCWTNECCDLTLDERSRCLLQYGGPNLDGDISSLPGITRTPWGVAKCGTGNAVIVGPGRYDDLRVHCIILAVGPMSPSCDDDIESDDDDSLHYIKVMMRSCIRSSLILAKHSQVQAISFPTLTSKVDGPAYEQTLMTYLKILVEETRHSDLCTLHIVANSEEESSKLIGMALELGLSMSE
jgi:hypothetical protein